MYPREKAEVLSCIIFCQGKETISYIETLAQQVHESKEEFLKRINDYYKLLCSQIQKKPQFAITLTDEEREAKLLIPHRNPIFTGPLARDYLVEKLADERIGDKLPLRGNMAYEAANFINGKRSLLEIRNALIAEYGEVKLVELQEYFKILQKAGLIQTSSLK